MGDIFHCRKFSLSNSHAGLKVGTDGVLLGAAVSLLDFSEVSAGITQLVSPSAEAGSFLPADEALPASTGEGVLPGGVGRPIRILDIGTGTGIVALILAQRLSERGLDFRIVGIDINEEAAAEAAANFAASPWADKMEARAMGLQQYVPEEKFDMIISNPPYYDNSPKARDAAREGARHAATLSWRDVAAFAAGNLLPPGPLCLILPADQELSLRRYAASFGLYPRRLLRIRTTARKAPSRLIAEFVFTPPSAPAASAPTSPLSPVPAPAPAASASLAASFAPLSAPATDVAPLYAPVPSPATTMLPIEEELTLQDGTYYTTAYVNLVKEIYTENFLSAKVKP